MKKIVFILLIAELLAPVGLMAQKVYKDGTKIILDMTVMAGMPIGAVTSTAKYDATYMGSNTPVNSGSTMADNVHNQAINAMVYQKLEVAPQDLGTSGLASGTMTMNWATAFTACKGLNHNGTGWRLPTQRELMMIWIFKDAINALNTSGTSFSTRHFWASTEISANIAWMAAIESGLTSSYTKSQLAYVRCVREL